MTTNKDAVKYLERLNVSNASYIVSRLIDGGFLDEDELTEPEIFAKAAKSWLGDVTPQQAFNFASGWSTGSWEHVLKDKVDHKITLEHNLPAIKNIFAALVILAKEAGVEL